MELVRFGVVGCGRIGSRHAEEIAKNKRARLVAVCDIVVEKAINVAKRHGCSHYEYFEDMLSQDLDVLCICTPSGMHAKMSIDAMKSGKNVLCEKPMTLNLLDAENVVKVEKETGMRFFLVKQNRYNPPIRELKNCVYKKQLGDITLVNSNVMWNRRKDYYDDSDWKGTIAMDGGALMTQCSHFLDLIHWIGGPVRSVYAKMANLTHSYIETEDAGFIVLVFENGALGSLQYTTNVYEKNFEGTMTVLGTLGSVKVGGEYLNLLEHWNVKDHPKPAIEPGRGANDYGTYKGSMSNHDKVIENVVRVLNSEEEIATNSVQGRDSIEIMQAAYISALENREVLLPLSTRDRQFKLDAQQSLFKREHK